LAQVGEILLKIASVFLNAYTWVILARSLLSFFMSPMSTLIQFLHFLTEPVISPVRKLLAPLVERSSIPLDLSPLVAFVIIVMVQNAVEMLIVYLYY